MTHTIESHHTVFVHGSLVEAQQCARVIATAVGKGSVRLQPADAGWWRLRARVRGQASSRVVHGLLVDAAHAVLELRERSEAPADPREVRRASAQRQLSDEWWDQTTLLHGTSITYEDAARPRPAHASARTDEHLVWSITGADDERPRVRVLLDPGQRP